MTVAPSLPVRPGRVIPVAGPPAAPQLFKLTQGSQAPQARVNVVLYGNSGVGKTALATALPWGTERWGDKAIYVPWDSGSETLLSVRPADREHLIITELTPPSDPATGRLRFNPYKTGMAIASANWPALVPEAKTIIFDGVTRFAEQVLRGVANDGATVSKVKDNAGESRLTYGDRGDPDYFAQPIIPDYGMAQNIVMQFSEAIRQQPLNVIVICVSDYYKPEGGGVESDTVGGPATVGVKIIPKFMKDFDNVWRISIETETTRFEQTDSTGKPMPPRFERTNKRILWTEKHGIWDAKIRKPPSATNPLARVELTPDPTELWRQFDASGIGVKDE